MVRSRWLGLIFLVLAAMACSSAGAYRAQGIAVPPEAKLVVQSARDDLRVRTGSGEMAEVRSVEAVEWPDTSLGCPEPGMMYAQVITAGYRIVLALGEQDYVYHASASRAVFCPQDGGDGKSLLAEPPLSYTS